MSALAPGQLISDRYLLDRRIAVGGMGEVWEASDTRLGRSVAVKVLKSDLSDDPEFLHRFRIEARTVASLDHTGIAAVHDYGEDDGPAGGGRTAYLVMELVRGEPLSTRIARGPIPMHEALDIVEQAARALQAAHERGFVHRDVKPGNILLRTDGVVKLTDFGIAKAADAVPVTRSGMVMGTAHYIAPEQASGEEAGPAGDVYSLGIVGYECLAGHRPFRAESAVAVAMMQVRDDPPPLPTEIPERVRELISSVLVKDPERRYADGAEFAEAVAAVRRGQRAPAVGADVEEHNAASWTTAAPSATPRRHADDPDPSSGAAPSTPAPNTPAPRTPAPRTTRGQRPTGPRSAGLPTHAPTSYDAGPQPRHRSGDLDPRRGGPGGPEGPRHPSGPVPLRSNTPPPGTPHPSWSTGDGRPAGDAPWRPPQRPVRSDGPSATEHPSGPLDFSPRRSGRRRALLAALFVLLTIAAVLLAVLILRGTSFAVLTTNSMIYPPGTVSGWKADLTGPAVPAWPPAPLVADGAGEAVR